MTYKLMNDKYHQSEICHTILLIFIRNHKEYLWKTARISKFVWFRNCYKVE